MQSQMFGFRTKILNFECLLKESEQYACQPCFFKENDDDDDHHHNIRFCYGTGSYC